MTRCFEVSSKRYILTAVNSRSIYNRETDESFPCRDEELFNSLKIGDYFGVDKHGKVIKRVDKEIYLLSFMKKSFKPAIIVND